MICLCFISECDDSHFYKCSRPPYILGSIQEQQLYSFCHNVVNLDIFANGYTQTKAGYGRYRKHLRMNDNIIFLIFDPLNYDQDLCVGLEILVTLVIHLTSKLSQAAQNIIVVYQVTFCTRSFLYPILSVPVQIINSSK